jgi:excinuclease ABC subunit C
MDTKPLTDHDLRDEKVRGRFLLSLPHKPGVYIMKGLNDRVLYVGKAIDLNKRVNSYFRSTGDNRWFIEKLPLELVTIEIIIVSSEREALLLENNLIKEMKPKYNVLLKDDRSYLSIRLRMDHPWPRFETVRGTPQKNSAQYFGPYHNSRSIRSIISFITKYYKFRTCSDKKFASRKRPCLSFHLNRCDAPCVKNISKVKYRRNIKKAVLFIKGETHKLLKLLNKDMEIASHNLEFEQAANIRDLIFALEKIAQPQNVITSDHTPVDVVGYAKEGDTSALVILEMRNGVMNTHRQVVMENMEFPDDELLGSYLMQHYTAIKQFPDIVAVPFLPQSVETMVLHFNEQTDKAVKIILVPDRYSTLMGIAQATARSKLTLMGELDIDDQLSILAKRLRMRKLPRLMECYDISHLQGSWAVGSMAVFVNGKPDKKKYRRFNIKKSAAGDDYGALREVMERRLLRRNEKGWELPDLIVIDGGKGQLNSVAAVFQEMQVPIGADGPTLISLAKERDPDGPPDRFFLHGVKNAVHVKGGGRELYILSKIRDEAHRFAIEGHRKKRENSIFSSTLDKIPGVGPSLRRKILLFFGSLASVKEATVEELTLVDGIGNTKAQEIWNHLNL